MASVTLVYNFDSDNADDDLLHARILKANAMAGALFEIGYNLRKKLEWIEESKPDADIIQALTEHLAIIFDEHGITEDILI